MNNRNVVFAKLNGWKKHIKKFYPDMPDESGVYVFKRTDDKGNKFAFVGQGKKILSRIAQHFFSYYDYDLPIRRFKLYDKEENPNGWEIVWRYAPLDKLDIEEEQQIFLYEKMGYKVISKGARKSERQAKVGNSTTKRTED